MGEEVIRGSRLRNALYLALSALLCGLSVWLLPSHRDDWKPYAGIALFGLGVLVFAAQLIRPPQLVLGAEGMTYVGLFRRFEVRWADIESFGLWQPPRARSRLLGWTLVPEKRRPSLARDMAGIDGSLPGLWEVNPDDLLAKVVERQAAARRVAA